MRQGLRTPEGFAVQEDRINKGSIKADRIREGEVRIGVLSLIRVCKLIIFDEIILLSKVDNGESNFASETKQKQI